MIYEGLIGSPGLNQEKTALKYFIENIKRKHQQKQKQYNDSSLTFFLRGFLIRNWGYSWHLIRVEIIQELLERQALRRIEAGRLNDQEIERLGEALADLSEALDNIKEDNDLEEAVKSVRDGLDQVADELIDKFINPTRWVEGVEAQ